MTSSRTRTAAVAASLMLLLALTACGDRLDPGPPVAQANVEINRQGMEGAKDSSDAIGVAHDTNDAGGKDGRLARLWRSDSPRS
jgi:hyperosmotically inducible periplasmic protein